MKDIYKAARAIIYPDNDLHQAGKQRSLDTYPEKLARALKDFELKNRGHRNVLTGPAMGTLTRLQSGTSDYRRRQTIQETFQWLVQTLLALPPEFVPQSPEMDALLDARDELGWLRAYICRMLDLHVTAVVAEAYGKQFDAYRTYAEPISNGVLMHVSIRLVPLNLLAQRVVELPSGDLSTLRSATAYLAMAKAQLNKELGTVRTWEEFSPGAQNKQLVGHLREDLRKLVQGYSPEKREALAQHWSTLCPVTPAQK